MLKLTKKADYGLIAMRHLAEHADLGACSAKDLAEMYSIPQEALAKILQRLDQGKAAHLAVRHQRRLHPVARSSRASRRMR